MVWPGGLQNELCAFGVEGVAFGGAGGVFGDVLGGATCLPRVCVPLTGADEFHC